MRILHDDELAEAKRWIAEAALVGQRSTCGKSHRGVVIVKDGRIIGSGTNGPPTGFLCEPDYCRPFCSEYAVHAEQNAILDALGNGSSLERSTMYHVKLTEDGPVPSGGPSCLECSKLVVQVGIAEFVLWQDEGMCLYTAREFHEATLDNLHPRETSSKE